MRQVFADTFYWSALINPRDKWHQRVKEFNHTLVNAHLFTTDEILTEFLNFFSSYDAYMKNGVIRLVQDILNSDRVTVIAQTHSSFLDGLTLYQNRTDKGYSLTDCISMQTMRKLGITEILTHDRHFTQEGFTILFTD
ncbi:type II toxin-antitoxin system VapC family toxin [Spirulina sp. 06S082]|uniref:type II toxin-antitoxin system VapC family toxin n=1 Tax=Spirulina sp. 06S082 TaxID=3110248 RepID=UPI002B20E76E|nr:PIN domain-containing protein [Spirulina sp. 06S082]MEA5469226.1 PIN domain-containing protein [Spirulina sp. 06S082]